MIDTEDQCTIECLVHTVKLGDVEDPDLFVAEPIYKWQQTEEGKWIMENSIPKPLWKRYADPSTFGFTYTIHAFLTPKKYTYWSLKYK
jgi:hypothetical protein